MKENEQKINQLIASYAFLSDKVIIKAKEIYEQGKSYIEIEAYLKEEEKINQQLEKKIEFLNFSYEKDEL